MSADIIKFPRSGSVVDDLEGLLALARSGAVAGLVGYMVQLDGSVHNVTTDHAACNNATVAYCAILLGRTVSDSSDEEN